MAPNNHLTWKRLDKFGGLWDERPASVMPANAAQVMSGCHPQPAGGLRAFYRPRAFLTTAGLSRGAGVKWRPTAFFPTENQAFIVTALVDSTITTDAIRPVKNDPNVRVTKTDGTGWALPTGTISIPTGALQLVNGIEFSTSAGAGGILAPYASDGDQYTVLNNIDGAPGLYKFWEGSENFEKAADGQNWNPPLISHQDRLVAAYGPSVAFTSPGLADWTDAASATPNQPQFFINFGGRPVAWILSIPPIDLLVGLSDGTIFNVQGDLADPTIRTIKTPETGAKLNTVAGAVLTNHGPVTMSPSLGPISVGLDGRITPLAPGLQDDHWRTREGGMGLAYVDNLLFARSDGLYQMELQRRLAQLTLGDPHASLTGYTGALTWPTDMQAWITANQLHLNGMLAYDTDTGAWFRSAHPDVADWPMPWFVSFNRVQVGYYDQGVAVGISGKEFSDTVEPLGYGHEPFGPRQHTWEWKSAPFHTDSGRQVRLREVQFGAFGHTETGIAPGTSTILVTAENEHGEADTHLVTIQPDVSQVYRARVRMDGTYVSVSFKAVSSHTAVEAPTLEFASFGFDEGKTVYQKAP